MRKLAVVLMLSGITMIVWYGYQHWVGMQSVTKIEGNVVKEHPTILSEASTVSYSEENSILTVTDEKSTHVRQETDAYAKLVIPAIHTAYDVFRGTSDEVLKKGVGMYESKWTTSPDQEGHTVLSGHRDSVFRPIGDLVEGDSLYVRFDGIDYEYKINKIWITDEDDRSVIVEKDRPTLTLSTCYPFYFIGNAPERYIVQAELVKKGDLLNL